MRGQIFLPAVLRLFRSIIWGTQERWAPTTLIIGRRSDGNSKIHQAYYTEKLVYLPDSYQANDAKRTVSSKLFTRAECKIPEKGFVFCCFNNNHKIVPEVFDCWMRILHQINDSVLWLLEGNAIAVSNLRKEAVARGISAERLVFAPFMPPSDHLARHRLADLFLDTLPFNAHTTTSDALWTGLPVLTQIGETFAGRVAASLLNAIDLPELITSTRQEYFELAIALATNPENLQRSNIGCRKTGWLNHYLKRNYLRAISNNRTKPCMNAIRRTCRPRTSMCLGEQKRLRQPPSP